MDELTQFRGSIVSQLYPKMKTLSFQTSLFRIVSVMPSPEDFKKAPDRPVPWKAKGEMPEWDTEDLFEFHGEWETSDKYGDTFVAAQTVKLIPTTLLGKERYLARNVKGVGPVLAKRIVDYFGHAVIDILDKEPHRLKEVPKVPTLLAEKIAKTWHDEHDALQRQVGLWLAQFDISDAWAKRFIAVFGPKTIDVLQKNPYRSMRVEGVGFRKADDIAARLGWPDQCPERTEAAFRFVMLEALNAGHTFMLHEKLVSRVRLVASTRGQKVEDAEQLPAEAALEALARCLEQNDLAKEDLTIAGQAATFYYLPRLLAAERRLAERLKQLLRYPRTTPPNLEEVVARVEADLAVKLDRDQRAGVIKTFQHNVHVLTGGPGTGKTTTTAAILKTAERLGWDFLLCAPTGRAAKRLAEVSGYEALTIHKLLEWDSEKRGFRKQAADPLDCRLLLVDEASMKDLELADALFDAVPDGCSVVLVGDIDQLPAVGPGMVLRDFIVSKRIAVTTLETIFRQGAGSRIVSNAHRIRKGQMPEFPVTTESDSFFMELPKRTNDEGKKVDDMTWVKTMLPKVVARAQAKYGVDPIRDIQVLCPMKKGQAGTPEFNKVLQAALNPNGTEITVRNQTFRIGDRVMQLVNNYQPGMDISNGDIGFVKAFDVDAEELVIDFYGRDVKYPFKQVDDLVLAYACTIHKSQGGEFPVVIVILSGSYHYTMLERNLLYTANTRAKKLLVYLASRWALRKAVETSNVHQRNTFLAHRIRKAVPDPATATPSADADGPDEGLID